MNYPQLNINTTLDGSPLNWKISVPLNYCLNSDQLEKEPKLRHINKIMCLDVSNRQSLQCVADACITVHCIRLQWKVFILKTYFQSADEIHVILTWFLSYFLINWCLIEIKRKSWHKYLSFQISSNMLCLLFHWITDKIV